MTICVAHHGDRSVPVFGAFLLLAACSSRPLSFEEVQSAEEDGGLSPENAISETVCDSNFAGPPGSSPADLPAPVAEWLFDEGTGGCLSDSTGNGNTARVLKGNAATAATYPGPQWISGHKGFAVRLDGVADWIGVLPTGGVRRTGPHGAITISAWVNVFRPPARKRTTALFRFRMANTQVGDVFLGLSADGKLTIGSNLSLRSDDEPFPIGQWTHVALTHDGYHQCGFVAGKKVACQRAGWPSTRIETPFTMGADVDENNIVDFLDGALDDVRVFSQSLVPEQIARLAQ